MIDRVQFVNEMKKALNLPDSYKVETDEYICPVTTDEILDPDGFDLTLGKQVFCFNLRGNQKLSNTTKNLLAVIIPYHILDEVFTVLYCEGNGENWNSDFRMILVNGSSNSRYCRFYSAYDYFYGLAGEKNQTKAVDLLVRSPWSGFDNQLKWIKDPSKKYEAAIICLFANLSNFTWKTKYNWGTYFDFSGRESFLKICEENYNYRKPQKEMSEVSFTKVSTYAEYLFETGKRHQAFFIFEKLSKMGYGMNYYLGVSYMFGFSESDKIKSPHLIPKEKLILARDCFENYHTAGLFLEDKYAYLSLLYWLVGDTPEAERNDRCGAEYYKYSISAFRMGMRLFQRAKKERNGKMLLEAGDYFSDAYECPGNIASMKTRSEQTHTPYYSCMKHPFHDWYEECGNTFKTWLRDKIHDVVREQANAEYKYRWENNGDNWWQ